MLLDEVVAEAHSSSDPAKDLRLEPPIQKVVQAWRKVASASEAAVSDFLQQHKPSTIAQRQVQRQDRPKDQPSDQPPDRHKDQPPDQPKDQPSNHPRDQEGQRSDQRA